MKLVIAALTCLFAFSLAESNSRAAGDPPAKPASEVDVVTFNKHIAPLVYKHCAACHRPGEVAPFSLLAYADVKKRAKQIQTVTSDRFMPPWKSVDGHGSFVGERRMSSVEIELISQWVKQGTPEGVAADLPRAKFPDDWQLGKPDIVVKMPAAYKVPKDGPDVYRNFVFSLDIPKGKYIRAAEYRPSNRRVVHHALLAIDETGRARKQQEDPALGFKGSGNLPGRLFPGSMATWTPGRDPMPLPEGLSMPWKSGADLVLQLHLHPSGKLEEEQSSIGLFLTDKAPQQSMADLLLVDKKIDITPGDRSYKTHDELTLPIDMEVMGVFPHMHMIGKEIKVTAHPPSGDAFSLLWINDWDFNWQVFYQCSKPIKLVAGTRIVLEAIHDNSPENIHNPNQPPKRVIWGEETANEMTVALVQVVPVREADFPKLGTTLRGRVLGAINASPPNR